MNKIVAEEESNCKFVEKGRKSNGHVCWGNTEWTSYKYVWIGNKKEYVGDGRYIIHDGVEVFDSTIKSCIDSAILKANDIVADRLQYNLDLNK